MDAHIEPGYWIELTAAVAREHRWICAGEVGVGVAGMAARLIDWGAEAFALGSARGTGELPDAVPTHIIELPQAASMIAGIRQGFAALESPSAEVVGVLDAFDPARTAKVLLPMVNTHLELLGRTVFGGRRASWAALEDKTTIDAVWDAAGVARAPSRIVPATREAAWAAASELDAGHGTVWVADNTLGWHGGAECLRWVRDAASADEAIAELRPMAEVLRVMPFLEGLPCSIHGIVFDDAVATFRPVEMIVLRRPDQTRLHYAQAGSFWEPPESVVSEMRAAAIRTGEHLRSTVDYRGAFTIDGVLTADGFRPTELNARYGAALNFLTRNIPGLWMYFLCCCVVERLPLDFRPAELESMVLARSRAHRSAGGMAHTAEVLTESRQLRLALDGAWRVVEDPDAPADATANVGPGPMGGIVLVKLDPVRTPVGVSSAPRVASLLEMLDGLLGLNLGPLEAAPDPSQDCE